MTRTDFIDYLVAHGCEIVRVASQGYNVMRNTANRKMSGVPVTDPPLPATVCRICKTLEVPAPDVASHAQGLIDEIQNKFDADGFVENQAQQ